MNTTRIALIGVGNMGQAAHLQNYTSLPDCEVVAIAESRPMHGKRVASRYGIDQVFTDHKSMMRAVGESIDGIVACQPYQYHRHLLPELLSYRKPLLIEKPIAASVIGGRELAHHIQQSRTPVYIGYHKRSDPAVSVARDYLTQWSTQKSGESIRYIRICMPPGDWIANGHSHTLSSDESPPHQTFEHQADETFDELVNYYIHQINLMQYLMGDTFQIVGCDAAGITMTAQSSSGVVGIIEMAPWQTHGTWQEHALIACNNAWLRIDFPAPLAKNRCGQLTCYDGTNKQQNPTLFEPQLPWVDAMRQQADNFCRAIRGENPSVHPMKLSGISKLHPTTLTCFAHAPQRSHEHIHTPTNF